LFSQNVNSLRALEPPHGAYVGPFPELTFAARWGKMEQMFQLLRQEKNVEIFALQEVGPDAKDLLENYFSSINHQYIVSKYCLDEGAQQFVFAFDPTKYELISEEQLPYTTTGRFMTDAERKTMSKEDVNEHNYNSFYDRSAQIVILRDLNTKETFKIYNTHPGLTNKHRLKCMELLASKIAQDKEAGLNVVVTGDMNQFDFDSKKPVLLEEQPQKLKDAGLTWINEEELRYKGAQATFNACAYDIERFLTDAQKDYVFGSKPNKDNPEKEVTPGLIGEAQALKNKIIAEGKDPQANEELLELYQVTRNFFIQTQTALVFAEKMSGACLSTVLDFIGAMGPHFGEHPDERYEVKPITHYQGKLFDTTQTDGRQFELDLQQRNLEDPVPSDHFGLLLQPRKAG
jgi:endonuclease/exonuclease/phosphatase family metal-dependent hydrolase